MAENTLNKIIDKKKQTLNEIKRITSIESLKEKIKKDNTFINFFFYNFFKCIFSHFVYQLNV